MSCKWGAIGSMVLVSVLAVGVSAQTTATLVNFDGSHGANPRSALVRGTDGNFYGTSYNGGPNNYGTVFKVSPVGALTVLHNFTNSPDGARPWAGLVQGSDGNFYGTTPLGGVLGGGLVFKITPAGVLTRLYSFGGSGGTLPYGGLVQGSDGNFYGTTYQGGVNGSGTVFRMTPSGSLTTLYSFGGPDGAGPYASLVQGTDGNFYGTTYLGGANNDGTVFQITPAGALTTLYSFSGADGNQPYSPLVQGSDGNFYGTTRQGGAYGNGTVFQITSAGALTSIHSFCSPSQCNDGSLPYAGLVEAGDGSFYGTTGNGGHYGFGVVYRITSAGVLTTLHAFNGTDGRYAYGGVTLGASGNLYGATYSGGSSNNGTLFSVSPTPFLFTPVAPCRLLDTRMSSPIQGRTFQTFDLRQLAQTNGCADLSSAGLYSLNVTLVPVGGGPVGFLTIWPAGENQPSISTMNSLDGRIKANAAIVPGGVDGAVNIYVTDTTNVVLDVNGYFTATGSSPLAYYALAPCRVADTRNPNGVLGGPYLQAGQERDFPVMQSNCHIPNYAQAYALNVTAVPYNGQQLGFLTVWPAGGSQPTASTLNNPTGTIVANAALVAAGSGGGIAVYPTNDTQLVIDVNGYFAPPGPSGLSLYPAVPCRTLDTRHIGTGQPFSGTLAPAVDVPNSGCGIPATAQGYIFNTTVVPSGFLGYLTLWPDNQGQPIASTLNAADGRITSNMAIVPSVDGRIDAYASGLTQLILDISSYFAR